jgi:hypothetical protein
MSKFKLLAFLIVSLAVSGAHAESQFPDFYQYPIGKDESFDGSPATVDLTSYPDAKRFRTKLNEGSRIGPNFAGHYTVVTIGCGTSCQENWIIDARTGKILNRIQSMFNTKYQLDSTLFIVNPPDPDLARGYKENPDPSFWNLADTSFLNWQNNKFDTLYEDKWVNVINALPNLRHE